jgi:hypothetical protein
MSSIQALFCWKGKFAQLSLLSKDNIVWLLPGCSNLLSAEPAAVSAMVNDPDTLPGSEDTSCDEPPNQLTLHRISNLAAPWMGPHCGLLPISGTARRVWTTGLKWDVHGQEMKFGGLISTSNSLVRREKNSLQTTVAVLEPDHSLSNYKDVLVATSDDLVWSCSYNFDWQIV